MGSGKTSVAIELSKQISKPFIDLDNLIEKSEKMTIKTIFDKYGEIYFRKKERFYLENIINSNNYSIISLGVWLRKSEENFVKRLVKSFEDLNNVNTL